MQAFFAIQTVKKEWFMKGLIYMPFDKTGYYNKRNKEIFDDVRFRVLKGCREILKQHAEMEGKKVNEYIIDCINEHEERRAQLINENFVPIKSKLK